MARGILCKETHDRVIRLAPPLVIEEQDLRWLVSEIHAVLGEEPA
jgi:ornithine--oxo-acid transaminase